MGRRVKLFLATLAVGILSIQAVSAASVTFTNFSYTTSPYAETLEQVASKSKADNEQNWYATLTSSSGLSSSLDRALLTSNTSNSSLSLISALVPLYTSTTSIKEPYFVYTKSGTNCKLYITGDQNNGGTYTVKISGRYTS